MNNDQLLKYIENIGHLKYTELSEIINNFNISSMGTDFFSKWKNVDWMNLFKNKKIDEKEFYKAVCNKINEIKYFGLLFELFDINNNKKDYSIIMIQYMQEKFQYLIINKPGLNEYTIFIEDVSNLIFYSEIKKINSIGIIKNILNIYSENIIEQIYKKLIEKNIEYSEELTKLITNFFIKNIKKADISCLFYIIKNKKEQ